MEFIGTVKAFFPELFIGSRVLKTGSLDMNGSVRTFFEKCEDIGLDIRQGPGVDRVCSGREADYPANYFDVVVSAECLEHNPYWSETLANMLRMLRPGGLFLVTCATTGRQEHGTRQMSPQILSTYCRLGLGPLSKPQSQRHGGAESGSELCRSHDTAELAGYGLVSRGLHGTYARG